MTQPLTLMAIHAHPDDESSSTGGILARYSAEGVRTVVVTCTNGEFGDGPGGVKPGEEGHDPAEVAEIRRVELETACQILGVSHLERLGYSDSGMSEWEFKDSPDAFCNIPIDVSAGRLSALFEEYRPDVVVTYEDDGFYDHPDHLRASLVTLAALKGTGIPKKAYFTAMRRRDWEYFRQLMLDLGMEVPEEGEPDPAWLERVVEHERRITTNVDTTAFVGRKRKALNAHASQIAESFFGKIPEAAFAKVFGRESFIRAYDVTGAETPEDDLLAGLR